MNKLTSTRKVAEIVAEDRRLSRVFNQLDAKFIDTGKKTVGGPGREKSLGRTQVKGYRAKNRLPDPAVINRFNKWSIDKLIDYIIDTHHSYARKNAAIIYYLAQNVADRHNERHPELLKLVETLFLFLNDLLNHLKKEEQILFPNIRQLAKKKTCTNGICYTTFGFIRESVTEMIKEHRAAGNELKSLRELTNNYSLPADACTSYKYLFEKMKELEDELYLHVHLENNILFPKAIRLDDKPGG